MIYILSSIDEVNNVFQESVADITSSLVQVCRKARIISNQKNVDITVYNESFTTTIPETLIMEATLIKKMINSIDSSIKKFKPNKKNISEKKDFAITLAPGIASTLGNIGVGVSIITGGTIACSILDYGKAVEFKDDVKFQISKTGKLRITFPFYKIESIEKFNTKTENASKSLSSGKGTDSWYSNLKGISDELGKVVTNQARISEKDFTLDSWDNYYNDTIESMKKFGGILQTIGNEVDETKEKLGKSEIPTDLVEYVNKLHKQIPKDIKLITKFNTKLHKVFEIITNPKHSPIDKLVSKKFEFNEKQLKEGLDIYKFDNKYLLEAIRSFNTFYAKSEDHLEDINVHDLKTNKNFQHGLDCINKQFNANINYHFNMVGDATIPGTAKLSKNDKITVSEQGFDLHGAKLDIFMNVTSNIIMFNERNRGTVFGQYITSVLCHEIFHNIAHISNMYKSPANKLFDIIVNPIQLIVIEYEDLKSRIKSFILETTGVDVDNRWVKNIMDRIKNIYRYHPTEPPKLNSLNTRISITRNNRNEDRNSFKYKREHGAQDIFNLADFGLEIRFLPMIQTALVLLALTAAAEINGGLFVALLVNLLICVPQMYFQTKMENTNEETMCDMFAAMYQLPVHFVKVKGSQSMSSGYARKRYANMFNKFDVHSATYDRETVSYNLAKEMLNSGEKLAPEIKEYLQYIVDDNEGINETDRQFTKKQIKKSAPAFTADINRAVNNFVASHPNIKYKK